MADFRGNEFNNGDLGTDGADTFISLAGNDVVYGFEGEDQVRGGEGNDFADAGGGNDAVFGGLGDDVLLGGFGDDFLAGGTAEDEGGGTIGAPEGNDVLDGGEGNDVLDGYGGDDRLFGGSGADTFFFFPGEGNDAILDFRQGEDKINLTEGFTDQFGVPLGFSALDTNANGVLDDADADVTVGFNTAINFTSFGSPTELQIVGQTALNAGDFVEQNALI
jgi:Ca2+-binding RTX toxin-like protein